MEEIADYDGQRSGRRFGTVAIPSRKRPSDAIEDQLMIIGFAQWFLLAELACLFHLGIDAACEDDLDT